MRILLLGRNGQVGYELQRVLAPLGTIFAPSRAEANLQDAAALRNVIQEVVPDIIVNAAAYTAVDKAESEPEVAMRINGYAVGMLAEYAGKTGAWLVHYSTDYIFDGTKAASYVEEDAPNPLNVYGRSKLEGERAIQDSGCSHLVFRTSWVYSARGSNFVKTILRLAQERDVLKVVDDQVGAPTSAQLIADVTAKCIAVIQGPRSLPGAAGIYHLTALGQTSWFSYARFIVETASQLGVPLKVTPQSVHPIPSGEFQLQPKRPLNSRLCVDKLRRVFSVDLPHWQDHVKNVLAELVKKIQA